MQQMEKRREIGVGKGAGLSVSAGAHTHWHAVAQREVIKCWMCV